MGQGDVEIYRVKKEFNIQVAQGGSYVAHGSTRSRGCRRSTAESTPARRQPSRGEHFKRIFVR